MAFMTGFFLLADTHTSPEKRAEVLEYLRRLGFELYEIGAERLIVFYVEAPTIKDVENLVKMAESHPGVVKAYIAFGFVGDKAKEEEINRMIETGELEIDESTIEYIKTILAKLGVSEG